jgi:hypothetical protein
MQQGGVRGRWVGMGGKRGSSLLARRAEGRSAAPQGHTHRTAGTRVESSDGWGRGEEQRGGGWVRAGGGVRQSRPHGHTCSTRSASCQARACRAHAAAAPLPVRPPTREKPISCSGSGSGSREGWEGQGSVSQGGVLGSCAAATSQPACLPAAHARICPCDWSSWDCDALLDGASRRGLAQPPRGSCPIPPPPARAPHLVLLGGLLLLGSGRRGGAAGGGATGGGRRGDGGAGRHRLQLLAACRGGVGAWRAAGGVLGEREKLHTRVCQAAGRGARQGTAQRPATARCASPRGALRRAPPAPPRTSRDQLLDVLALELGQQLLHVGGVGLNAHCAGGEARVVRAGPGERRSLPPCPRTIAGPLRHRGRAPEPRMVFTSSAVGLALPPRTACAGRREAAG